MGVADRRCGGFRVTGLTWLLLGFDTLFWVVVLGFRVFFRKVHGLDEFLNVSTSLSSRCGC